MSGEEQLILRLPEEIAHEVRQCIRQQTLPPDMLEVRPTGKTVLPRSEHAQDMIASVSLCLKEKSIQQSLLTFLAS